MLGKRNNMSTILSLSASKALDYFMKSEQFHGFELPEYFDFDALLKHIKKTIGEKPYEECLSDVDPERLTDININILLNKDGRYAVRPITLCNPFLYYFLAREVTSKNWDYIKKCFGKFTVPHITSCALPVVSQKKESFFHSNTIQNWWNTFEQKSIELSLEYRYMFVTDITNCYGSINPQAFDWALSMRNTKHETAEKNDLAKNIQMYLRALQQGKNIGIPQGSAVFDFIGEIILGYSDLLLHESIEREGITDSYEILRYRDDYRVFCNNKNTLERISYLLQQVLESLNFRMNSQKTKISDSIVTDSIKSDKLFYIYNTPIFSKKGVDFDSFEKHLLYILMFGKQFPNGGQLRTMLNDLDKRIADHLKPYKELVEVPLDAENKEKTVKKVVEKQRLLCGGSVRAMCAVAVQIALENVSVSHYVLRVISRMIDSLKDNKEKQAIVDLVYNKLCNQPNSDYNQLWLQNMTYTRDKKKKQCPYTLRLCQLVMGQTDTPLWNNDWLKSELTDKFPNSSIINKKVLKEVTPVISFKERWGYGEMMTEVSKKKSQKIEELDIDVNELEEIMAEAKEYQKIKEKELDIDVNELREIMKEVNEMNSKRETMEIDLDELESV